MDGRWLTSFIRDNSVPILQRNPGPTDNILLLGEALGDGQCHEHLPLKMSSHFSSHIPGPACCFISQKVLVKFYQEWEVILSRCSVIEKHQGFWKFSESKIKAKVWKSCVERLPPNPEVCQDWVFAYYMVAFIKKHVSLSHRVVGKIVSNFSPS